MNFAFPYFLLQASRFSSQNYFTLKAFISVASSGDMRIQIFGVNTKIVYICTKNLPSLKVIQ